jgi:hypothetical protein
VPLEDRVVLLADVDGDGRVETLVTPPCHDGRLLCLESDGRLRFARRPAESVRFGGVEFSAPWQPAPPLPVHRADGSHVLWAVYTHRSWFPSRLEELTPRGELVSAYWSNGHLRGVTEASLGGRDLVLAWGTHNETHGASLAVFDRGAVRGHAPATDTEHRCDDCTPGGPREFLVFPRSCVWIQRRSGAGVAALRARKDGLTIRVSADNEHVDGRWWNTGIDYELDSSLTPTRVRVSPEFVTLHARLEQLGVLDHRFDRADEKRLQPVLRWDGRRFAPLPLAPLER